MSIGKGVLVSIDEGAGLEGAYLEVSLQEGAV